MNPEETLTRNAVLYKDITQWLRSRVLGVGIILFLLLCLVAVVMGVILQSQGESEAGGAAALGILSTALSIYGLVIVIDEIMRVERERATGTLELMFLTGLAPEAMTGGWFMAAEAKFLLGFFAVLPFLMVTWTMGGVDFRIILRMIFYAAFAAPAGFLGLMWLAMLRSKKGRGGSNVARAVVIVLVLWMFGPFAVMMLGMGISMGLSHAGFSGGATSVAVSPTLWLGLLEWISLALVLCSTGAVFFYAQCERLAGPSDWFDAEGRCAATALVASLSLLAVVKGLSGNIGPGSFVPLSIVALLLPFFGLHYLISSKDAPPQERLRQATGGRIRRLIHALFGRGAWGGFQAFVLMIAIASLATLVLCPISPADNEALVHILGVILQAPWFVALPALFALANGGPKGANVRSVRIVSLIVWFAGGIMAGFIMAGGDTSTFEAGVSAILSPLSTLAPLKPSMTMLRMLCGGAGLLLSLVAVRHLPPWQTLCEARKKRKKHWLQIAQPGEGRR